MNAGSAPHDTGAYPSRHEGFGVNQRVPGLINKGAEFQELALTPGWPCCSSTRWDPRSC